MSLGISAAVVDGFCEEGDLARMEISSADESAPVMVRRAQDVFDVVGRAQRSG